MKQLRNDRGRLRLYSSLDETSREGAMAPLARAIVALVRGYQRHAAPGLRAACRYTPSCSEYAIGAVEKYGALRGSRRALIRFRRCRAPYGGIDEP